MDLLRQLKDQDTVSREDIAQLLSSIGKPGQKRKEKLAAVEQLDYRNNQDIHISETLNTYSEY